MAGIAGISGHRPVSNVREGADILWSHAQLGRPQELPFGDIKLPLALPGPIAHEMEVRYSARARSLVGYSVEGGKPGPVAALTRPQLQGLKVALTKRLAETNTPDNVQLFGALLRAVNQALVVEPPSNHNFSHFAPYKEAEAVWDDKTRQLRDIVIHGNLNKSESATLSMNVSKPGSPVVGYLQKFPDPMPRALPPLSVAQRYQLANGLQKFLDSARIPKDQYNLYQTFVNNLRSA